MALNEAGMRAHTLINARTENDAKGEKVLTLFPARALR